MKNEIKSEGQRQFLSVPGTEEELAALIRGVWRRRADHYSEIRSEATLGLPKVEMSYIGG